MRMSQIIGGPSFIATWAPLVTMTHFAELEKDTWMSNLMEQDIHRGSDATGPLRICRCFHTST